MNQHDMLTITILFKNGNPKKLSCMSRLAERSGAPITGSKPLTLTEVSMDVLKNY